MQKVKLGDILPYEQPAKYIVASTKYSDSYETPVLTAGKTFLLGYTNEVNGIYGNLPCIIFDDFTTVSKFVNFPFKVKSSAMKILTALNSDVNLKYFYYLMQTIHINSQTHKRFWISEYSKVEVTLPPPPEQERIVQKIEELFSELDKGIKELTQAKARLKVYRQAVLKDAFEQGKSNRTTIIKIVDDIKIGPFGTSLHQHDYINNGIPVINPKHIKNLKILEDESVSVSHEKANELSSYKLQPNDIIMGRRGEMGRVAPITERERNWICGTGSIIFRLKPEYDANLYAKILSSPDVIRFLEENATGTTMKNLNEKIVKHIPIPDITKEQQGVIFSEIESRLSVCDNIEQTIHESLKKAENLRQSILKKAFEGELV